MEPKKLSDFVDFSDTTPLDKAISRLETFIGLTKQLESVSAESADALTKSLKEVEKSADDLDTSVADLDATYKEHQKLILESAAQADKLLAEQGAIIKQLEAEKKAREALEKQVKALMDAKEKLKNQNKAEAGSIEDMRKKLKDAETAYIKLGESASASIKQEHLDKIKDLATNITKAEAAMKQAKKGTEAAAGSYDRLKSDVEAARKELKAMEGGIGMNSIRHKELTKTVKDGTAKLQKFDEATGSMTKSSRGADIAIGKLDEATGGAITGIKGLAEGFKAILMSPVGLVLIAIAGAVASLAQYFQGSVEGQDAFNEELRAGEAILETFLEYVEQFGKFLYTALTQPKKTLQELWDFIEPVRTALVDMWNDPIQAIQDFGKAIVDNVLNRFKSIGVAFEAIKMAIDGDIVGSLKKLGDAGIQAVTGITDGTDKIVDAYNAVADAIGKVADAVDAEYEKRKKLGQEIAKLENQLRKDRIADIIDDAKTEASVAKALSKSQDELRNSGNERFEALRKANAELEDQLKGDIQLAKAEVELQRMLNQQGKDNYENREKLARLQAAEIGLTTQYQQALKKRQSQESALLNELEKTKQEQITREREAQRMLNDYIVKSRVEANKDLIADERTSFEERAALIEDNGALAEQLAKSNYEKELTAAREAAIQRVKLNTDQLNQIYGDTSLNADEIIALNRKTREGEINTDQAYLDEVKRLGGEYTDTISQINDDTIAAGADNIFKLWAKDFQDFQDKTGTKLADDLTGLNEALANGNISFKDFLDERELLQDDANEKGLKKQLKYLENLAENAAHNGYDTVELQRKIAETKLALSDQEHAKLIEGEQLLQDKLKELRDTGVATALSIIDSFNERGDMDRQQRLETLTAQYETETQLAGDNDAKKLELQNAFNIQKEKLDKEQKTADRKRAIFQKSLALVEIAINTAKGIGLALGTYPPPVSFALAAVTAVLGALQVAAVLAKPIPAFAEGTDFAPQGYAMVNDGNGPELIVGKGGARMVDSRGPAITYLDRGDRVYTADETADIIRGGDRMIAGFDDDVQKIKHIKAEHDVHIMTRALAGKLDEVTHAIKSQRRIIDAPGIGKEFEKALSKVAMENTFYK